MMAFFFLPQMICTHLLSLILFRAMLADHLQVLLIGIRTVSTALLRILKNLLSAFRVFSANPIRPGIYQLRKQRYQLRRLLQLHDQRR